MAYPTDALSRVLEDIDRRMIFVKQSFTSKRDQMAAGDVVATVIVDLHIVAKAERAALVAAAATPGIVQYARDQKNDQALDVVTEFNSVISALDGLTAWIEANFPAHGSGFLLRETWGANGPEDRTFDPATTAGLRTEIDAVIALIN